VYSLPRRTTKETNTIKLNNFVFLLSYDTSCNR
jgi:hypothetical protein